MGCIRAVREFQRTRLALLAICTIVPALAQTRTREEALDASSVLPKVPQSHAAITTGKSPEQFLNERLAVWQECLSLNDWQISIVMTRRSELKPKTRGQIKWDKDKKNAVLAVLDASDYELPISEMLADMEFTLVHELVHLELASLPRSEATRSREEHAVNRIAEALLRLNRQK